MNRSSRWLIWTGPLFAVVFMALSFIAGDTPSEKASGAKIIDYYDDHKSQIMIAVFASPLGCALLLLFVAQVYARARAANANTSGPAVMIAGAAVWSAGLLLGSMVSLAQVDASDKKQAEASIALNFLQSCSWVPFIGGIAVFLIGAGMTALGTRVLPTWLGWFALVIGIVSLAGPGGFLGFFGAPLWILIAGIVLAMGKAEPARTPAL